MLGVVHFNVMPFPSNININDRVRVCVADALLCRPLELPLAITTIPNGATAPVNVIASDAVVPETVLVMTLAPAGSADRSDFNTINPVTPDCTLYFMLAMHGSLP